MASDSGTPASYYRYEPSVGAAALFAVLYGVALVLTLVQWLRFKPWVWLVMVIAAAMEAIGYISRTVSARDVSKRTPFVLQFALLILAPVLMAGCYYVLFGRIVFHAVPREKRTLKLCWIPPRFLTPTFVLFDVIALLLQLGGAVMITSANGIGQGSVDRFDRGRRIALAGVIIQLLAFGLFTIAAFRFNLTVKRLPLTNAMSLDQRDEYGSSQSGRWSAKGDWRTLLYVVNFATLMILIRSVYRLVEFTEGRLGYINTHEWCMYVFDALPILPCVALFIYWHPSIYLPYLGFVLPKHAH